MDVTTALQSRVSTRCFRPDPVPDALIYDILDVARWAPSGGNLQPWQVIVVAGEARDQVVRLAQETFGAGDTGGDEYPIYPAPLHEPYRTRRFVSGEQLYDLLGIPRADKEGRLLQVARNLEFFGAPAAVFFIVDRRMGHGQWAHLGMFMQSVALVAQERGVSSCFQEFWGLVRAPLADHFGLDEHHTVYCALALGYADESAPENALRTERADVAEIATFLTGHDGTVNA